MRILQTATDAINVARIDRIAYLNREERIFDEDDRQAGLCHPGPGRSHC